METIDKVLGFLGESFGNGTTGPKWGGIASVALGSIGGYLLGGPVGAAIGLGLGTLLSTTANSLITNIMNGSLFSSSPRAPEGITPAVVRGASETLDLSIDGKQFKIALPKVSELKRPWGSEGADGFIHKMGEDTLRIVKSPENKEQSLDILLKTLKERNQPYYDYLATVQKYHDDYETYNRDTRPAMMAQLGLTDKDGAFLPPAYQKKLHLDITSEKELALDARAHLGISEADWNKLDSVTKLSRIEESMNKRMIEVSRKQAKLKADMEALGRKIPFDIDFSGAALGSRLNGLTFEIFGKTADTRIKEALNNYYNGKPADRKTIGGTSYLIRDEKAAEDEFRAAMDGIAGEFVAKGHRGGDAAAEQFREMTSMIIEEHKVRKQWNGIESTKKIWASQAERWTKEAEAFRGELTTYAATYANGASANKHFAVVGEVDLKLMGNSDAKKRADDIRAEKKESLDAVRKASDGVRRLLEKLNMTEASPRTLIALQPVDIDKDIRTLPTWDDVMGGKKDKAPAEDTLLRKELEAAAVRYNAKVTAFKANSRDNRAAAELKVAHESMGDAMVSYLKTAALVSESANKSRDEHLAQLAKESSTGTDMEGKTGFRIFVADKRPGKTGKIALDGIKQNGKYIVTAWSRMTADDHMGEGHFFGKDIMDTAKGVEFDPKSLKGMDALLAKIEGAPAKPEVRAEVEPARPVVPVAPAAVVAPVVTPVAAPVAAKGNMLEQALASVSFKPLADAADTYVMPMLKDWLKRVSPLAAH